MPRLENLEENKVKMYFEATGEHFEEGLKHSYHKNKGSIDVPGFRKGRVPRKIIEMTYGKEIFYGDAIDFILPEVFKNAAKEMGMERSIVSQPEFDTEDISTETGVSFTAEFYVKPKVTLEEYRGLTYKPFSVEATDEEINAEIEKVREKNSRILTVERPIENSDIAIIDFEGFVDGEAFEGGKAEDHELVIGSHSFIDTFEEQLIGKETGDKLEVNVTFPDEYHSKELAGKKALFKVAIKEIKVKELPEVDDEFAQDVSEFDTLTEYKQDIAATLKKAKEADSVRDKERQLVAKLAKKSTINVPEIMFENEVKSMVNDLANRLSYQGMDLRTYLHYSGLTPESLMAMYRPEAEKQVRARLALEAIAEKEDVIIGEQEVDEELKNMAESYGMEFDKLKESIHEPELDDLREDLKLRAAVKIVIDSAEESPDDEASADEEELA